jgi:quercetin dioxygenase-like cupin family protein
MGAAKDVISLGPISVEFLVESGDSRGSVTVFECTVAADARVPVAHSHDAFEETIYGLVGVSTWTIDGDIRDIAPGGLVCINRGQVHGFHNHGEIETKFLAIASPGVFGPSYFHDLRDVIAIAGGGSPDPAEIVKVMTRHGLTPAQPTAA